MLLCILGENNISFSISSSILKPGFSFEAFKGSTKRSVTQITTNLGESPTICYSNQRLFFPS